MRRVLVGLLPLIAACDRMFGLGSIEEPDAPDGALVWSAITTGATHSCAISESNASLWCWGRNELGQLGLGSAIIEVSVPTLIDDASWSSISTAAYTTCGIRTDRTLWCWGYNAHGQVGNGTTVVAVSTPTQVPGSWVTVEAGPSHTCALDGNRRASCWGYGLSGALGSGTPTSRSTPVEVNETAWTSLALGSLHTCGISEDDSLWCWGDGTRGALGVSGAPANVAAPMRVDTESWSRVVAGTVHTCGTRGAGGLFCWGTNDFGQVGSATLGVVETPILVDDAIDWSGLFSGGRHTCGIGADRLLRCWGDNARGETGDSLDNEITTTPTVVSSGPASWVSGAAGQTSTCAIATDHTVWCMGGRASGLRGDGVGSVTSPTKLEGQWQSVFAGYHSTCAIDPEKRLHCWGHNIHGKLGDGTARSRQVPHPTGEPTDTWLAAAIGFQHSCGLRENKSIACWGYGEYGQLGTGTMPIEMRSPQSVANVTAGGWKAVAADVHNCAIDGGDKLWCWGPNAKGGLGTNDTATRLQPTSIEPTSSWLAIDLGGTSSCGIVAAPLALKCWGDNGEGQVGNNMVSTTGVGTPTTVAGVTMPGDVVFGYAHACVRDGTKTKCWGRNGNGQLGLGDQGAHLVPTMLNATWSQLALGHGHTCGVEQGTLWCWGSNLFGQTATPDLVGSVRVQRIGIETDWRQVATGESHSCALKTDGTLWCWGANDRGQLGLGTAWDAEMTLIR